MAYGSARDFRGDFTIITSRIALPAASVAFSVAMSGCGMETSVVFMPFHPSPGFRSSRVASPGATCMPLTIEIQVIFVDRLNTTEVPMVQPRRP